MKQKCFASSSACSDDIYINYQKFRTVKFRTFELRTLNFGQKNSISDNFGRIFPTEIVSNFLCFSLMRFCLNWQHPLWNNGVPKYPFLPKSLAIKILSMSLIANKWEIRIFSSKDDEIGLDWYFWMIMRYLKISDAFELMQKILNVFNFGQNIW